MIIMSNKFEQYEIEKKAIIFRLYETCKNSFEFQEAYDKAIRKLIKKLGI